MIGREYISEHLAKLGFNPAVLSRYEEPHRHYHNMTHLMTVLEILERTSDMGDDLFLAAVYHDAVYDPRNSDNEERSADLFKKEAKDARLDKAAVNSIAAMITDTKDHQPGSERSRLLCAADLNILEQPLQIQIKYEHNIFREYQYIDYKNYVPERIKTLEKINKDGRLDSLIAYIRQRRPAIGVFCGSFNPFHKGHYNILQKAERIFDKVIIAFGKNPEKYDRTYGVPSLVKTRQIEEYDGLLTDFVQSLGYEVVVIRGLRNSTDFQYEQNQYRYIQELMPDIRIVSIFCDKEFEHISSSGIRTLEKFDKHRDYLLD